MDRFGRAPLMGCTALRLMDGCRSRIEVPFTAYNPEFGDRNGARLFICASRTLCAIYANTRGATRPPDAGR